MSIYDIAHSIAFPIGNDWYEVHPALMRYPQQRGMNNLEAVRFFEKAGYWIGTIPETGNCCLQVIDPDRPELVPDWNSL